jgi:hemolysin III
MKTIVFERLATPVFGSQFALLVRRRPMNPVERSESVAQDRGEELVNSITHGLGLVLSVVGISALVTLAANIGSSRYAFGCGVYGASLVMLYTASTLFHSWPPGEVKRVFLLLDHIGIYILIAGTYTPIALFASPGTFAWSRLEMAWGLALFGSFIKIVRVERLGVDSALPYVVMSGLCVMSFVRFLANVTSEETSWLLAGGFFYLAGLVFFFNDNKRFYHSIWHLFVLAGSVCHYRAVLGRVITELF